MNAKIDTLWVKLCQPMWVCQSWLQTYNRKTDHNNNKCTLPKIGKHLITTKFMHVPNIDNRIDQKYDLYMQMVCYPNYSD